MFRLEHDVIVSSKPLRMLKAMLLDPVHCYKLDSNKTSVRKDNLNRNVSVNVKDHILQSHWLQWIISIMVRLVEIFWLLGKLAPGKQFLCRN